MIRKAPISMIMTSPVVTLKKQDSLEKAEKLFKKHHIRHIPVVTEDVVVGMLSYTDLLRLSFADVTDNVDEDADALVYNMFTIKQVMKKNIINLICNKCYIYTFTNYYHCRDLWLVKGFFLSF